MKNKTNKDIILIITYVALVIFALVNVDKIISALSYVVDISSPFLIGIVLAFVLNVLNNFIEKKIFGKVKNTKVWKKVKRPLSITLSLITITLIIVFIINLLIPQLQNSVTLFLDTLPEYKEDILGILDRFDVEEETVVLVSDYLDNSSKVITDYIKDNSADVLTVTTEFVTTVFDFASMAVISVVFAIYVIAQKENLMRQCDKIMTAYLKPKIINKIKTVATLANKTFANFVTGQCLEAIIFGSLCFVGLLIFRIPYAPTVAVLLGFTALIPIFGAIIGIVLGAVLIVMVSPIKAIVFIILVIVIQQIENNLIYPKVVGKSVGLPGMWVLVSVTIGGSVGGLLGLIIATPLCSLIYALLAQTVNEKINRNKITSKIEEKTLAES